MPFTITKQIRDERRADALARQAEHNKLTTAQKLATLPPDGAKRERARLEAQMGAEVEGAKRAEVDAQNAKAAKKKVRP